MHIGIEIVPAFVLLAAANATPVIVAKLANERWAVPMDFGYVLPAGERNLVRHLCRWSCSLRRWHSMLRRLPS